MPPSAKPVLPGTRPAGAHDEEAAARAVRDMFTAIAPRYDLLNHILSFNVDRLWWRRAARTFRPILQRPGACALDLCCGTADMALALRSESLRKNPLSHEKVLQEGQESSAQENLSLGKKVGQDGRQSSPEGNIWASPPRKRWVKGRKETSPAGAAHAATLFAADFSHAMLKLAARKVAGTIKLLEADALHLPLPDGRFDLVVSAFGFRNLANYDAGLREIFRVLRPGGEIAILDFGEPKGMLGKVYRVYFRRVLPVIGTLISGVRGPYAYLPASVERFPDPNQMLDRMRAVGFRDVTWTRYTFGIAGLYRGKR